MYRITRKWSDCIIVWWIWEEIEERIIDRFIYSEWISKGYFIY